MGRAGSSWHLLPMALWHWTPDDEGLRELSPYPRTPQGLAHSGYPKSRAWAGKGVLLGPGARSSALVFATPADWLLLLILC